LARHSEGDFKKVCHRNFPADIPEEISGIPDPVKFK
jgi:hypothetical protein